MEDNSTVGEGILAWICMNLGFIPLFWYLFYLHTAKKREWEAPYGLMRKRSSITFWILTIVELAILLAIFIYVRRTFG